MGDGGDRFTARLRFCAGFPFYFPYPSYFSFWVCIGVTEVRPDNRTSVRRAFMGTERNTEL